MRGCLLLRIQVEEGGQTTVVYRVGSVARVQCPAGLRVCSSRCSQRVGLDDPVSS